MVSKLYGKAQSCCRSERADCGWLSSRVSWEARHWTAFLNLHEPVREKREATGFVGMGEDLPELWLECLTRRRMATYRCAVPAQKLSTVFWQAYLGPQAVRPMWSLTAHLALSAQSASGVVGRSHMPVLWLRNRQVGTIHSELAP